MATVNWTKQAISDVEQIAATISEDSIKYAKIQVGIFFDRVKILEAFPMSGRKVPEIGNDKIREVLSGSYRIIYKINSAEQVTILTVYHSKRLLHLKILESNP